MLWESPYIVGPSSAERSRTEKNGNKSAMQDQGQATEGMEKANEYKAFRLSVAPMMDWAAVTG